MNPAARHRDHDAGGLGRQGDDIWCMAEVEIFADLTHAEMAAIAAAAPMRSYSAVMSRADVQAFLLSDPRIATRIAEILGRRVAELERRLSDTVFKSVPQRVAATLCLLARDQQKRPLSRGIQVMLTHEQIAALTGTSRETTTKVLDEYADRGLLRLSRGKVTILDPDTITAEAGD